MRIIGLIVLDQIKRDVEEVDYEASIENYCNLPMMKLEEYKILRKR